MYSLNEDRLSEATAGQLEQAAAFNHTELFRLNAISVGGTVHQAAGVVWTNTGASIESMVAFPNLAEDLAGEQLDDIMQDYLRHPPWRVGCWSLDPPQPKDLGIRLLARGFQPGWRPNWMALDMEELQLDHPVPTELRVEADNTTNLETIHHLPYGNADTRIFSHQQQDSDSSLQRFVAKLDGKIVAQCSVLLTRGVLGTAGIYHVGVLPDLRNRGIGKAVVGAACAFAHSREYRYALLNGTGRRMYEQLGFRKLGDGYTWWMEGSRLTANPPGKKDIALAEAIGRGDIPALEKYGGNMNTKNLQSPLTNGMTLMQLAVHCRQIVSAEWLIAQGITINTIEAWDLGWKDRAAAILVEQPYKVNERYGDSDITMLHMAAERGDPALANLVLSAKPDLDIKDKTYKSTPLEWAKHLNRHKITRLIEMYINSGSF